MSDSREICEGTIKKGGQNPHPTTPRPAPPQGQAGIDAGYRKCACSLCSVEIPIKESLCDACDQHGCKIGGRRAAIEHTKRKLANE